MTSVHPCGYLHTKRNQYSISNNVIYISPRRHEFAIQLDENINCFNLFHKQFYECQARGSLSLKLRIVIIAFPDNCEHESILFNDHHICRFSQQRQTQNEQIELQEPEVFLQTYNEAKHKINSELFQDFSVLSHKQWLWTPETGYLFEEGTETTNMHVKNGSLFFHHEFIIGFNNNKSTSENTQNLKVFTKKKYCFQINIDPFQIQYQYVARKLIEKRSQEISNMPLMFYEKCRQVGRKCKEELENESDDHHFSLKRKSDQISTSISAEISNSENLAIFTQTSNSKHNTEHNSEHKTNKIEDFIEQNQAFYVCLYKSCIIINQNNKFIYMLQNNIQEFTEKHAYFSRVNQEWMQYLAFENSIFEEINSIAEFEEKFL